MFAKRLFHSFWDILCTKAKNPQAEEYRDRQVLRLLSEFPCRDGWGGDFGGRDGRHGRTLRARIVTLDVSPQKWRKEYVPRLVRADVHDLPCRSESLGYAFGISLLELLRCPERFLREARRVLAPQALLLLTIPNFRSAHYFFWFLRDVVLRGMEISQRRLRAGEVLDLLTRSGFRLVRAGGFLLLPFSLLEHLPRWLLTFFCRLDERLWLRARSSWCSYYYFLAVRDGGAV